MRMEVDFAALYGRPHEEIARLTSIDARRIYDECREHSSTYGYYLALYEVAKVDEAKKKRDLEQEVARAWVRLRPSLSSVAEADRHVLLDPAVEEAYKGYLTAQRRTGILRALTEAMRSRENMLIQLSVKERKELESELQIGGRRAD